MAYDFSALNALMASALDRIFPAAQVQVRVGGVIVYDACFGFLDPEARTRPTEPTTRFDLASVSKLFTVVAFMTLVEEGRVGLDQPVAEVLPEFGGRRPIAPYPNPLRPGHFIEVAPHSAGEVDAGTITFRQLLSHSAGLPAWLPLWKMLATVTYGPIPCAMAAPTEFYAHHGRRMCGEVHDENAFAFGGVAGHAGLFGTAQDVAAFGEALRGAWAGARETPLRRETLAEMTRLQAQQGDTRRGLGFALRSPNPSAMSYALSESAFGHLGFTGTALWIDPARALVFACLTNHVYYGRTGEDTLTPFRAALTQTIVRCVQSTHGDQSTHP